MIAEYSIVKARLSVREMRVKCIIKIIEKVKIKTSKMKLT